MIYTNNLLKGEKVHLAAVNKDDLPLYQKWFSNSEFQRLLSGDVAMPKTLDSVTAWYEGQAKNEDEFVFGIRTLEDNTLLGTCSVFDFNHASRNGTVGIYIGDPDNWGKGYGSDAMRVLVRFGFMDLNLHRIELHVFSYNARAIKAYEKVGFVQEGALREALYRDGTYHDIHIMSILQREWMAKHHPEVK